MIVHVRIVLAWCETGRALVVCVHVRVRVRVRVSACYRCWTGAYEASESGACLESRARVA